MSVPEDVCQEYAAQQDAEGALAAAVEKMRQRLRVGKDAVTIVAEIKKTMHTQPPSRRGLTIFQILCERERQEAFNKEAAEEFPELNRQIGAAIRDFMIARDGRATARKVRQLARNAWNEDAAADRRAREMERRSLGQSQGPLRSPYRARPEVYDPDVVTAFANAIAQAAEQPQFSWTRRVDSNKSGGVMLDVLVAAVDWAMCSARLGAGAARSKPVRVKAEGLLRIIKAARRT